MEYERPIRSAPTEPQSSGVEYENPRSFEALSKPREPVGGGDIARGAGVSAGAGAALGVTGLAAMLAGKHFFPGSKVFNWTKEGTLKNWLRDLDKTIRVRDKESGLKDAFGRYMASTGNANRTDQSFLDYLAGQGDPNVSDFIGKTVRSSGREAQFDASQKGRAFDSNGRILKSLSSNMGIPDRSLPQTMEELIAAKRANADPLYAEAFKDRKPLRDSRLYDFLGQNEDVMKAALDNARESFKYDPSKQVEQQTRAAVVGPRKDSWKYVPGSEVPSYLNVGEPRGNLQSFISPNMETLDRMKQALWSLGQKRKMEGAGDYGNINRVRREFTDMLDTVGPDVYKQARSQFKGDVEMQEAAELGGNIFKMKPNEVKAALDKMGPHEREAAAMGFYGAMKDVENAKLLRQYVTKPEQYRNQNDILQMMFRDPVKRDDFLNTLDVEHGIQAGTKFGNQGTLDPKATGNSEYLGISMGPHGIMPSIKGAMVDRVLGRGVPRTVMSPRASEAGLEFLTKPAIAYPSSVGHPMWGQVNSFDDLSGAGGNLRRFGKWGGYGAAGGTGLYGLDTAVDALTPDNFEYRDPEWGGYGR